VKEFKLTPQCRGIVKIAAENGFLAEGGWKPRGIKDHRSYDKIHDRLKLGKVDGKKLEDLDDKPQTFRLEDSDFETLEKIAEGAGHTLGVRERKFVIELDMRLSEDVKDVEEGGAPASKKSKGGKGK
jgi:hypothetical protein